jgi:peptidoglycan DL-endopeptidase CwlO
VGNARITRRARRAFRISRIPLLLMAILSLVVGIAPAPSYAGPSVGEIEKQIDAAYNKLEPVIEDYNRVHSDLAANKKKADALEAKLEPLELQAQTALSRLQPLTQRVYELGPNSMVTLLFSTEGSGALLNQLAMFDAIADQQREDIASVVAARDKYEKAKVQLDALVSTLQAQNADLATKKASIEKQIDSLQKLRLKVYGTSGPIGNLRPVPCPYTYITGAGGVAAKAACSEIGKPYVWAADGPSSFDCSGLTLYAWAKAGVTLRHYTKWQWEDTKPITRSQLRPGDLVFFYPPSLHHVGLYVGSGWMVHAPHTGDVVRMAKIDTMPIAGYRRP